MNSVAAAGRQPIATPTTDKLKFSGLIFRVNVIQVQSSNSSSAKTGACLRFAPARRPVSAGA